MNFSEVLTSCGGAKGGAVAWSPDGRLVAWPSSPTRLQVRDSASLQMLVTFTCVDAVQEVLWAPDSQHLLSASYKRGMLEVWAVDDPGWRCRVDGGSAGIIAALWSPDSRHILTTAEFYVQLTVWSLVSRDTCCVRRPKAVVGGAVFSPSGGHLAIAERRDCRDYLALFETQDWTLVKSFQVCTRDLVGVSWGGHTPSHPRPQTNTGSILAVWDSPLQYKVALYSLSGYCLGCYSAYEWELGVMGCLWSPSGQFLAVCSYDDKVRLLSYPPGRVAAEFPQPTTITTTSSPSCVVYKETRSKAIGYVAALATARSLPPLSSVSYTEETSRPVSVATIPPDKSAPCPPQEPYHSPPLVAFSSDGRYLATRRLDVPYAVWIWDISAISLKAVLVQDDAVKDMAWDPRSSRLAVITGGSHLYFWSPLGTVVVAVPNGAHLHLTRLRWHPFGKCLVANDRKHLSVCFLDHPRQPSLKPLPP